MTSPETDIKPYTESFALDRLSDLPRVLDTIEAKLYAHYNMTLQDIRGPEGARVVCKWGGEDRLQIIFEFFDERPEPLSH